MRLPERLTPASTSSVVDFAPNVLAMGQAPSSQIALGSPPYLRPNAGISAPDPLGLLPIPLKSAGGPLAPPLAAADLRAMHRHLEDLRLIAVRHARGRRTETAIAGLAINMSAAPTPPQCGVYEPMLCLVLQGAKEVTIGDRRLRYDPASYFVASLEVPASGGIV